MQPNTQYAIRNTRYAIRNTRYAIRNTQYELQATRYELRPTQYAIRNTLHERRDTLHLPRRAARRDADVASQRVVGTAGASRFTRYAIRNTQYESRPGIALIWTAIILIVLILFVGLALDVAKVSLAAHQLQNAADAAALAGARIVRIDQPLARTQAQNTGGLNYMQRDSVTLNLNTDNVDPNGDIIIGHYYPNIDPSLRSFVPTVPTDLEGSPRPNAVKVAAKRTEASHGAIPLIFGPIAHVNTANVARDAIALAEGGLGAGLIVLSEEPYPQGNLKGALTFNGQPEVYIVDGSIQVNNPLANPVGGTHGNTVIVYADEFNVVSKTDSTNGYVFNSATGLKVTTDQPKIPDPYADLPAPAPKPVAPQIAGLVKVQAGNSPPPFEPGYYPGGFKITGGNVIFKPGIYVIGGNGIEIGGGDTNVCAKRVMFYVTGGGQVKIDGSGKGTITITEINDVNPGTGCDGNTINYSQGNSYVAPYIGMAIFQDHNDTTGANITGGSGLSIAGTIYFPHNNVNLTGNSGSFGIQVIAYTIEIGSTGGGMSDPTRLYINYDGRNRTPAKKAYLVE